MCAKLLPEDFWQLEQWQRTAPLSTPVIVMATAPQRQVADLETFVGGGLVGDEDAMVQSIVSWSSKMIVSVKMLLDDEVVVVR